MAKTSNGKNRHETISTDLKKSTRLSPMRRSSWNWHSWVAEGPLAYRRALSQVCSCSMPRPLLAQDAASRDIRGWKSLADNRHSYPAIPDSHSNRFRLWQHGILVWRRCVASATERDLNSKNFKLRAP
jgi:hypothetical protein